MMKHLYAFAPPIAVAFAIGFLRPEALTWPMVAFLAITFGAIAAVVYTQFEN